MSRRSSKKSNYKVDVGGHSLKNRRVLITCGPTWVPIDDVRVISNRSTGELGHRMAWALKKAGAQVTLLEGPVSNPLKSKLIRVRQFSSFNELRGLLRKELRKKYHAVIHAAAVSDYQLKEPIQGKLTSRREGITLNLIPTEKLISLIKQYNPETFLVGFKLEPELDTTTTPENCRRLFNESRCDVVIVNTTANRRYRGYIMDVDAKILGIAATRQGICERLAAILQKRLR